jgi:hypothetical protein
VASLVVGRLGLRADVAHREPVDGDLPDAERRHVGQIGFEHDAAVGQIALGQDGQRLVHVVESRGDALPTTAGREGRLDANRAVLQEPASRGAGVATRERRESGQHCRRHLGREGVGPARQPGGARTG